MANVATPDQVYSSMLTPEGDYIPSESKYDCCAFVIYCKHHNKVAVSQPDNVQAAWLPFTSFQVDRSWDDGASMGALITLSGGETKQFTSLKEHPPFEHVQCMQVLRVQLPHTRAFITRLIYYVPLTESKAFKCCHNSKRIKWIAMDQILNHRVNYLWGPELIFFSKLISEPIFQKVIEFSLEEAFLYVPRNPPRNIEEEMLKSIHITEKDVERLYLDFLDHCFPSFAMTIDSFTSYMAKYGIVKNDPRLVLLFKAFGYLENGYLSFHELLIGLATIEPSTIHGHARIFFIFRYYNSDNSELMTVDTFSLLVRDMNQTVPPQTLKQKVAEGLEIIGTKTINGVQHITMEDFFQAIGSRKFRGTSNLCRSTMPIFTQISQNMVARNLKKCTVKQNAGSSIRAAFKGDCITCKEKEFKLATHYLRINSEGKLVDPIQVVQRTKAEGDCFTSTMYSIEFVFNKQSTANVMIRLIHQFSKDKGTSAQPKGLLSDRPEQLLQLTGTLVDDLCVLLEVENKCTRVLSPCYIIGDIHGNLEDLLSLEKSLWKRFPCAGGNYLFLGDYVDRGKWGLECALYIMALKTLMPNEVIMLRGNHEVRLLQEHYSYKSECCTKYGEVCGQKIWELTNTVFDKLPVAAVVDDAIYCAHGGIPHSAKTIEQINSINKTLRNPEVESKVVWEILWSDPCHAQQFNDACTFMRINPKDQGGFVRNNKRGAGNLFNEMGANDFLQQNGLTHIVRAHEVPPRGFIFHFGHKCITIFSCSHYCGNDNACSCLLADNQVLRIIRLDTQNNASATE